MDNFPTVKKGSEGKSVVLCQCLLTDLGFSVGSAGIDGIAGGDTVRGIRAFQKHYKLTVDGVCGNQTWTKLIKEWWDIK